MSDLRDRYLKAISKVECKASFGAGYNFAKSDFVDLLPENYELTLITDNTTTVNIYDIDPVINTDFKKGFNHCLKIIKGIMQDKGYKIESNYVSKHLHVVNHLIYSMKETGITSDEICQIFGITSEDLKRRI